MRTNNTRKPNASQSAKNFSNNATKKQRKGRGALTLSVNSNLGPKNKISSGAIITEYSKQMAKRRMGASLIIQQEIN